MSGVLRLVGSDDLESSGRCFDAGEIAQAATLDDAELDLHFAECLVCRRALEADRRTRASLAALPLPRMPEAQRRALAAEILAAAPTRRSKRSSRAWPISVATSALAVAAAAVLLVPSLHSTPATSPTIEASTRDDVGMHVQRIAADDRAPTLPPPKIEAHGGATLTHRVGDERDVLVLVDGVIDVDTRSSRDVDVRVGSSTIRIDDASVRITAHEHAIESVQVVVGAARVIAPDQQVVLERDSIWMPSGETHGDQSLSAFRDGWIELRAGHNREAMELFDRVTDPVVLEEAMYWAAIAAERTGDAALGAARMREFQRRFPSSELGRSK